MYKKSILSVMFLLLCTILIACNNDETEEEAGNDPPTEQEPGQEQMEMPEPDLEGIPDIVAEVNDEEISRAEFESAYTAEFQRFALQAQMSGQEMDQDQFKEQVAESMIGQRLLIQQADNEGIEATEEEMDETIDLVLQENQLESQEDLFALLEEQGTDEAEFMQQVEAQVKLDKVITDEAGDLEATDDEVQALYDQLVEQQEQMNQSAEGEEEQEIPELDEIRADLENQIIEEKEAEVAQEFVESLRGQADVTNHL